jgi:WD40 repeat protein
LPIPSRSIRLKSDDQSRVVVTAIAADPQGEFLAAAGDDHAIRILRSSNLQTVKTLRGHRDLIRTLAFNPEGTRLASAGNDGQLILWNAEQSFRKSQTMQGTPALACVRFAPESNEMAAVGFDNEVFVIGRRDRKRPNFACDCKDLRSVAYREDSKLLAVAGRSGDLHLFDPANGRMLSDHSIHRGRIHDLVFHHQSNRVVCVAEDGHLTVFDTGERKLLQRVRVTTGKLFAVAVVDSQLVAVAGSDNVIRIVNTDDGTVVRKLDEHGGSVSTLAASGGVLFSGSYDATLRRWSLGNLHSEERIAESDPRIDR